MKWWIIILILIIVVITIRVRVRGYFWKNPKGEKLNLKEFLKRWKRGTIEATPMQQTRIMLWAFLPMVAGITWGIVITIMAHTYWLTLILCGSLPLTLIQILSTYQKYKRLKIIEEAMKNAR